VIGTASGQQLVVLALFDQDAIFQHQDAIGLSGQ
jgi:hypothetical protein